MILGEKDAEELHELLRVTWADTYHGILSDSGIGTASSVWHSAETLRRQMKNKEILFAGYKEDGKLLGVVRAAMVDASVARIFQLYVIPTSQRNGIGTKLMEYSIAHFPSARSFILDVAKGNEKGLSFYRSYGFVFLEETTMRVGQEEIVNLEGTLER
ncbi:MAG: GNAT family N-acetyltransferase [Thaumarchaeota archaeon]|nr:GNAT family N-acetyltransferase [Nitrososphaerota archaeon]